jgi:mannosyltransferase OCH1-like enzyme
MILVFREGIMRLVSIGVLFFLFSVRVLFGKSISEINFSDAMKRNCFYDERYMQHTEQWRLMESLYKTYQKDQKYESQRYIIPALIHFIWLGSPLPLRCRVMIETWKKFHPNWRIKIWTEADLQWFPMQNRAMFDRAKNWGEKADIWRYEILYRFGGLYADTDFECLKSFDHIHKSCELYAGLTHDKDPLLGNSLIGSIPGHPVLKLCIDSLKMGPGDHDDSRIQLQTGPYHFTRCFLNVAKSGQHGMVAFPVDYFFPFPHTKREETRDRSLIKSRWVLPDSYALHYWDVSWLANGEELPKF